jgi:hypothetical protein
VACAFFVICASGCSDVARVFATPDQRINTAFPLNFELRQSVDLLLSKAAEPQRKSIEERLDARLRLRAVNCAKGYAPGRFATAEEIRTRLTDTACFAAADVELLRWVSLLRIGQLSAAPPLVPVTGRWANDIETPEHVISAEFASSAAVMVLDTGLGHIVVDGVTGRVMRHDETRRALRKEVSPNGRLIASSSSDGASISDAESGASLLDWPSVRGGLLWIDDRTLLARHVKTKDDGRDTLLIDLQTGESTSLESHRLSPSFLYATKHQDQFIDLSSGAPRQLSFDRSARKVTVSGGTASQQQVRWEREAILGPGKAIGSDSSSIYILDLETLTQQRIDLSPLNVHSVAGGSSLNQLRVELSVSAGAPRSQVILDLSTQQLSKLMVDRMPSPRLVPKPNGAGLFAIQGKRLIAVDLLPTEAPMSLNQFAALASQQLNDARLQQFERRLAASQTAAAPIAAPSNPLLAELAKNAQIEGVGVYQAVVPGGRQAGGFGAQRLARPVNVRVRATEEPLILVLSSYEPVHWMLQLEAGAKLSAVVVSGYYGSEVFGAGKARTFQIGRAYAYSSSSPEYQRLNDELQRQMGRRIQAFQGRYEGSLFSVGG